jgi:tRNA (guanine10-N2)-dimethyltransferase
MSILFVLKQHHSELAAAEAKAASFGWGWWTHKTPVVEGTLLLDTRRKPRHLGLSRFATKVIADCAPGNLSTTLASIRIPVRGSYRVVLTKQVESKLSERDLARIIWERSKAKVDLEHPQIVIDIVVTSDRAYIGARVWTNDEDFESRRAHLLPAPHPSAMHPALACALVNLSCATTVHDPFCGAGGVLIEAGLSQRKASGGDISHEMLMRARKNCSRFHLRPELRIADAVQWVPRVQSVIADLPYGRNTRPVALVPLYEAFLARAAQSTARAIIGLPCEFPPPNGWKVRAHFTSYIHKSMTKHFYVLERS